MTLRVGLFLASSLWLAACGPSEPRSPLVLGGDADVAVGTRALTASQTRTLQGVIASAGEPCAEIERTHLRDITHGAELWEVRCAEGSYSVQIVDDGTPGRVRRCRDFGINDTPCGGPYPGSEPSSRSSEPLNPDLGKLMAPMMAKDGKVD